MAILAGMASVLANAASSFLGGECILCLAVPIVLFNRKITI